jgi:hypothetical protein
MWYVCDLRMEYINITWNIFVFFKNLIFTPRVVKEKKIDDAISINQVHKEQKNDFKVKKEEEKPKVEEKEIKLIEEEKNKNTTPKVEENNIIKEKKNDIELVDMPVNDNIKLLEEKQKLNNEKLKLLEDIQALNEQKMKLTQENINISKVNEEKK